MSNPLFRPEDFFDLSDFPFKDIFDGIQNAWEVLPRIREYTNGKLLQGKDCYIAPTANIRGRVILGNNVYIGHAMELKNCIIMNNADAKHLSYIGDAVIGNNCNISTGAVFANFRLDKQPVSIKYNNERIDTGLRKFSAVVGDGTWVGVNSVLNPGTILGKNCKVYPLISVVGVYPNESVITPTK